MTELHGHPRAIVTFAPLLEENKLEELLERAKECYIEATKTKAPVVSERREEVGGGLPGMMRDGAGGGTLHADGEVVLSEREVDEAKRYLTDPACQRIWLEVSAAYANPSQAAFI